MNLPGAISTARLPQRVRALITQVNLHYAGAALLLLLNLYLVLQLVFAWRVTSNSGAEALAAGDASLRSAELQARPLQGLDAKLVAATTESDTFYDRRLPVLDSQVLTELGVLTRREGVKISHIQYAQAPILPNTPGELTELRMDASLTGDYRPLVLFINSLERDRMFFLIRGITLTGQQGGAVGLRLSLTTFLRPGAALGDTGPVNSGLPDTTIERVEPNAETSSEPGTEAPPAPAAVSRPIAHPALSGASATRPASVPQNALSPAPRSTPDSSQSVLPGGPPDIRSANSQAGGSSR